MRVSDEAGDVAVRQNRQTFTPRRFFGFAMRARRNDVIKKRIPSCRHFNVDPMSAFPPDKDPLADTTACPFSAKICRERVQQTEPIRSPRRFARAATSEDRDRAPWRF